MLYIIKVSKILQIH